MDSTLVLHWPKVLKHHLHAVEIGGSQAYLINRRICQVYARRSADLRPKVHVGELLREYSSQSNVTTIRQPYYHNSYGALLTASDASLSYNVGVFLATVMAMMGATHT